MAKQKTVGRTKRTAKVNHWQLKHRTLDEDKKVEIRTAIMSALEFSKPTFYIKMRKPEKLKFYEKQYVAKAYGVKLEDFFPNTEKPALV
jgi:hypothetical protein